MQIVREKLTPVFLVFLIHGGKRFKSIVYLVVLVFRVQVGLTRQKFGQSFSKQSSRIHAIEHFMQKIVTIEKTFNQEIA